MRPLSSRDTVDGASAVQLLAEIEARNSDRRVIHVIRDDAAYPKGPDVRAFLARPECRIHLIQLSPCCPHLRQGSARSGLKWSTGPFPGRPSPR